MKKIRRKVIITVIIIIWLILTFFVYKLDNWNKIKNSPHFILLNQTYYWQYENSEWKKLKTENEFKKFLWKEFKVYNENNYLGNYSIGILSGKTYYYDKNNNNTSLENVNLAINNDTFLEKKDFDNVTLDEEDNNIISEFLNEKEIYGNSNAEKYIIDEKNTIYKIIFNDGYSLLFIRSNNKNYLLDYNKYYDYDLAYIIDIKEKKYNIITKFNCDEDKCYNMWQYNKNKKKYKKIMKYDYIA